MIYVANDIGSKEFAAGIRRRINVPVEVTEMLAGDFAFEGNGPNGRLLIGIERKSIGDMLSSMRSGRYAGFQMPNMGLDFDVCYLLIEGIWRPNSQGMLEVPAKIKGKRVWAPYRHSLAAKQWNRADNRPYLYSELDKHLCTVELKKNVAIVRAGGKLEMIWQVINRYQWWQKGWDEHDSADPIKTQAEVSFTRISDCRKFANIVPGIGWKRSADVARVFGSIDACCRASVAQWCEVPGIGQSTAKKAYEFIRSKS